MSRVSGIVLAGLLAMAATDVAAAGPTDASTSKSDASSGRAAPSAKAPSTKTPSDPLAMDSLLDGSRADVDLTTVDPAAWAPEHAISSPAGVKDAAPKGPDAKGPEAKAPEATNPDADVKAPEKTPAAEQGADKSFDPEPDVPVVPTTPSESHDPLDRPRPVAIPKRGAATPARPANSDAVKSEAAKSDAAKAEPGKTDPAKVDPTKTGKAEPGKPDVGTPEAVEPLPPQNAAIKAALDKRASVPLKGPGVAERRKEREAVAFFYASHGFAPAWSANGAAIPAVDPVLARLAKAGDDALTLPSVPTSVKTAGSADDIAAGDLVLTEAVVAYARQATGARIDPRSISPLIGAKPDLADPAEVLDALIAAGPGAGDKLAALNPSEPRYVALRDKLAELRGVAAAPPAPTEPAQAPFPPGQMLRVGMRDSRVPLLRTRFNVEAKDDSADADLVYDAEVADAVKAFQRSHGLVPSGIVGDRTVAALSGGAHAAPPPQKSARLEGTIIANMEMWRWMPRDMGQDRIEVNVPDYVVKVYHDGSVVAQNRVVVGKTNTPTPIFSNTMKFLIVNPVWNVPQSIIKNEMGGAARGFKARYIHGQLYLQQPPGPGNALGRIKFMFPNDFSVYLHDTPSKGLFSASKRAFSHGCVRVDKPFEFAQSVLNDGVEEGGKIMWSQKRLQKMLGVTERYVDLPKPLPIHIEYFTASVDGDNGRVNLREDIYGYASAVAAALGHGGAAVPVAGRSPPVAGKPSAVASRKVHPGSERKPRAFVERRSRRRAYAEEAQPQPAPVARRSFIDALFGSR